MDQKTKIESFMDLDVWKVSHEFVLEIYKITIDFPKFEIYGLTSQLRRAAASIPSKIAEGNGKQYLKGYIQSLYISKGSLNEARYFLLLSKDLEYLKENKFDGLNGLLDRISMMLMALISSLKKKNRIKNNSD